MMTPNRIKERLEFYRKWFDTMKVKEFMNLPVKDQNMCLAIIEKFTHDCKKIHEEAWDIKEKIVRIKVKKIVPYAIDTSYGVIGYIEETKEEIEFKFPVYVSIPAPGDIITCTLFSLDGEMWFSSKTELITGRK
jgi:hypothetical protein